MLITTAAIALAIQVGTPAKVASIDTDKLKGEPTQLSWSEDATQLVLQTSERDKTGMTKNPRYFIVSAGDGSISPAPAVPAWADKYWSWKSNQYAPWSATTAIEVKSDQKTVSATSAPMGGSLAKGGTSGDPNGGGTSMEEVAQHKSQTQTVNVITLTLMGERVGYFEAVQFIPGYTFGWAPKDLGSIAYVNSSGRLAVMEKDGSKQQIESTKNVILPAWSTDGTRIAFLQRTGKNKYDLYVAPVTK
jgi:hypothetical protein